MPDDKPSLPSAQMRKGAPKPKTRIDIEPSRPEDYDIAPPNKGAVRKKGQMPPNPKWLEERKQRAGFVMPSAARDDEA